LIIDKPCLNDHLKAGVAIDMNSATATSLKLHFNRVAAVLSDPEAIAYLFSRLPIASNCR
jgi:hypothetical protein